MHCVWTHGGRGGGEQAEQREGCVCVACACTALLLLLPVAHSCIVVLLSCCTAVLLSLQVYDAFAELVAAKVSALRVGDGLSADTTHGPLITPAGVEKV